MSNPNLDSRYAKPADVAAAINAQAVTDAGLYIAFQGAWIPSRTYAKNSIVVNSGVFYVALSTVSAKSTFNSNDWVVFGSTQRSNTSATLPITSGLVAQFDAARGITLSSGRVSTWTDQSGNSNTATQSTASSQPFLAYDWRYRPVVRFNGQYGAHSLYAASSTSLDLSANSVFVVMAVHVANGQQQFILQGPSLSYPLIDMDSFSSRYMRHVVKNSLSLERLSATPFATGHTTPSSTNTKIVGSTFGITSASDASSYSGTGSGFYIGGNSSKNASADYYEVIVYNRAVSDTEAGQIMSYLVSKYALETSPYTKQLLIEGDSTTVGAGIPDGFNPGIAAVNDITYGWGNIQTNSVSGSTISSLTSRAAYDDTFYDSSLSKNILLVTIGRNDMGAGNNNTPAQTYANLKSYCTSRVAAGWEVWVGTIIAGPSANLANDTTYNGLIRGTNGGGTGPGITADVNGVTRVVDFNADPALADSSNLMYFQTDATHPTGAGVQKMGDIISRILMSV